MNAILNSMKKHGTPGAPKQADGSARSGAGSRVRKAAPEPGLNDGAASPLPPRRAAPQKRSSSAKPSLSEAQHLMQMQNEYLRAARAEVEETLRRYASLHDDLVRVQGDLAEMNKQLEQRVQERTAQLTSANKELQIEFKERQRLEHEISERERSSLSKALHDGVCQHLAGVVMIATTLSEAFGRKSDPEMAGKLKEIASLIRSATNDARDVARALHPVDVDAHGLVAALRQLVSRYDVPGRTRCVMHCHESIPLQDNNVAMHLHRIVLEALDTASRHARHISVNLGVRQQEILLTITDDGAPKTEELDESAGLGLKLMRYRASSIGATLSVTPRAAGGSVVRLSLPVSA